MKKKLKSVITSLSMLQLKKWHKLRHKISTKGGSEMKIYTLDDILKTEHLGDEKYVRVEEIERLEKEKEEYRVDNCKVNDERAQEQGLNMVKKEEIEQLRKEKKWLQYKVLEASQKQHIGLSYQDKIILLNDDMKQALKDK